MIFLDFCKAFESVPLVVPVSRKKICPSASDAREARQISVQKNARNSGASENCPNVYNRYNVTYVRSII